MINIIEKINGFKIREIFYSPLFGNIKLVQIKDNIIECTDLKGCVTFRFDKYGRFLSNMEQKRLSDECFLFPDVECTWRDDKHFDFENGFKPYDKVLVRCRDKSKWFATFFSHYTNEYKDYECPYVTIDGNEFTYCIPYNDDTKHLVGTFDTPESYYNEQLL